MERRYRLRWDPANIAHISRHGIRPTEVQEVCDGDPIRRRGREARTILIGPTSTGRMLAVVLELQVDGYYYPLTARPASRKERRRFADERGGQSS